MNNFFVEEARRGNVYHGSNTTTGDVTVLSTTCTGLILENPFASGVDLVLESATITSVTLADIREVGLAVSTEISDTVSATTTAAIIHNARAVGSNNQDGKGFLYSIATLPTAPLWIRPMANHRITTAVEGITSAHVKFDGTLIIQPGTYVCFSALTRAAASLCAFVWVETAQFK